jgi:N-acetylglucosamine-6-phosphate deacetylase
VSGARRLGVGAALVDGVIVAGDVEVSGDRVTAVGMRPGRGDLLALPGFVDLQVNGFAGVDFSAADVDGYRHAAAALARTGVTAFQPTLVTSPPAATAGALSTLATVRRLNRRDGARVLPAHLEGPFISPARCGAHNVEHMAPPSPAAADALCDAGPVGMMTLAPERDGALPVIAHLRRRGIVVSLGHSDATASEAARGFDAGATAVTHVLNAMRPISAREPGLAGAALSRSTVTVMAIVDGVHLADETLRLLVAAAPRRLCLVTDAIAAATQGDGDYHLGDRTVRVAGNAARLDDGTLAGSLLTMDTAVRNLVARGMSIADAVDAATGVPARLLGEPGLGCLRVGSRADLVIVDDRLELQRTLIAGVDVHPR